MEMHNDRGRLELKGDRRVVANISANPVVQGSSRVVETSFRQEIPRDF